MSQAHAVGQPDEFAPVYVISVAAQLAGMHPQTLRQYDRLGLVSPSRASGRGRRYSARDVALLRYVQRLSQDEGVNLAGIRRILQMQRETEALRAQIANLHGTLRRQTAPVRSTRIFAAGPTGVQPMFGGRTPGVTLELVRGS